MGDITQTSFPLNGWTYLSDSPIAIVFYQHPIEHHGGLPRITTRWEFAKPHANAVGRYMSARLVQEMDCVQGLSRTIDRQARLHHNLEGPLLMAPAAEEPWVAPDPGSLDEVVFKKACAPR